MKNIFIWIFGIAVLLVAGFYAFNSYIYNEKQVDETLFQDPRNGSYLISGEWIHLTDGTYEESVEPDVSAKEIVQYFGNEVRGDLDNDGDEDIAFILVHSGGGSGTFYYLVGAINDGSGYRGTHAMFIGDRIAPQTTEFRDGLVIVNYADRGPTDAMATVPYIGKSLYAKYSPGSNDFGEVVQNFEGESNIPVSRIVVKVGETKSALGVTMTPHEIISDSRCPVDVTCVWAGTVEVRATMVSGLGEADQVFTLNEPVTTEAEEITLLGVAPAPQSETQIESEDYVFTFEVKKR